MGQSLLVGYVYNNFDINFKTHVPMVENSGSTLTHLMSGTLILLEHGVTTDHLRCSDKLWQKSALNPHIDVQRLEPTCTYMDLIGIHPEQDHPLGLSQHEQFNSWLFFHDLCYHGPF
jgi:hypothetical protein